MNTIRDLLTFNNKVRAFCFSVTVLYVSLSFHSFTVKILFHFGFRVCEFMRPTHKFDSVDLKTGNRFSGKRVIRSLTDVATQLPIILLIINHNHSDTIMYM